MVLVKVGTEKEHPPLVSAGNLSTQDLSEKALGVLKILDS